MFLVKWRPASPSFQDYRIITNQSDHWHKIIDPTNILNTLDLEARNIYLVMEKIVSDIRTSKL